MSQPDGLVVVRHQGLIALARSVFPRYRVITVGSALMGLRVRQIVLLCDVDQSARTRLWFEEQVRCRLHPEGEILRLV